MLFPNAMPNAYTEDQFVEQPAIRLFAELGGQTVSAMEETFGPTRTLHRETAHGLMLPRLRSKQVEVSGEKT